MSTVSAVLWILGIALGIVVLCAIIIDVGKNKENKKFDERQQAKRNAGYRVAFYVGFAYYGYIMAAFTGVRDWDAFQVEPYLLMYFGILLQMGTLHAYALLTDSALPLGDKPLKTAAWYTLMGVMWLINGHLYTRRHPSAGMPLRGDDAYKWVYLTSGIFFLLLALAHLISMLRKRKEED